MATQRAEGPATAMKVAKLMQFESTVARLHKDVEKLMVLSAQHGMKIKELIVTAANSVSQVEFMAAITTTRFQNLNVVNTMKSADKPEAFEGVKPPSLVHTGKEEVEQLKSQVTQLENELFNQNFKSGMEIKKLENEVRIRQKEIYEVKGALKQLENKLEKFAEAVEAGGIQTNVHFAQTPSQAATPGGRKQSLFVFSDELDDSPQPSPDEQHSNLALADIPESDREAPDSPTSDSMHGDPSSLIPAPVPSERGGGDQPPQVESIAPLTEEAVAVLAAPASPVASVLLQRRQTFVAQRQGSPPAHARRQTLCPLALEDASQQNPSSSSLSDLNPAGLITLQPPVEVDMEIWTSFVFAQINNIQHVKSISAECAGQAVEAALQAIGVSHEAEMRRAISLERESKWQEAIVQTDEVAFGGKARRSSMRNDVRKASQLTNSFLRNFNDAGPPPDIHDALQAFQAQHQIGPAVEVPDYVYSSERKKRQSMRKSMRKEQPERQSLLVNVNVQTATTTPVFAVDQPDDVLDLQSGDVSLVMPVQPIPPSSAGIDTSAPLGSTQPSLPVTPIGRSSRPSSHAGIPFHSIRTSSSGRGESFDAGDSHPMMAALRGSMDIVPSRSSFMGTRLSMSAKGSITEVAASPRASMLIVHDPSPPVSAPIPTRAIIPAAAPSRQASLMVQVEASNDRDTAAAIEQSDEDGDEHDVGVGTHYSRSQAQAQAQLQPRNQSPEIQELHIEPLFLDDLSEMGSSSVVSGTFPPQQTFAKPSLGVQNVVEEARDDILDTIDRKLAKLCEHLNMRFQFVEGQYQRNNAFLHSIHTKIGAINEYIFKFSYPNFQMLIDHLNNLADRTGELEEWDKHLLSPLHEAMERYQDELREFRDNVDDMLQFKVREAVLQVQASERELNKEAAKEAARVATKEKSALALDQHEVEERVKKYAQTIFDPSPHLAEVTIFEAEDMQRRLRHYAHLFENLYGEHGSLLQRVSRLEEGPAHISQTLRRRSEQPYTISPSRSRTPGGAAPIVFSDDLPATPRSAHTADRSSSASPGRKVYQNVQNNDVTQLREELEFIKALLQVKLNATTHSAPGRSKTTASAPTRKSLLNVLNSSMEQSSIFSAGASLVLEDIGGGSRAESLPHVHPAPASRGAKSADPGSSRGIRFSDSSASFASSAAPHHATAVDPAPPQAPKPNPLLMTSPRRVVLSLDVGGSSGPVTKEQHPQSAEDSVAVREAKKLNIHFTPLPTAIDPSTSAPKDMEQKSVWYQRSMGSGLLDLHSRPGSSEGPITQ